MTSHDRKHVPITGRSAGHLHLADVTGVERSTLLLFKRGELLSTRIAATLARPKAFQKNGDYTNGQVASLSFCDPACTIESSTTCLGVKRRGLKKGWFQRQGKGFLPLTPKHCLCEAASEQRRRLYADTTVLLRRAMAVSLPPFAHFQFRANLPDTFPNTLTPSHRTLCTELTASLYNGCAYILTMALSNLWGRNRTEPSFGAGSFLER